MIVSLWDAAHRKWADNLAEAIVDFIAVSNQNRNLLRDGLAAFFLNEVAVETLQQLRLNQADAIEYVLQYKYRMR